MGIAILGETVGGRDPLLEKLASSAVAAGYRTVIVSRTAGPSIERTATSDGIPVVLAPHGDMVARLNLAPRFDPMAPLAYRSAESMRSAARRRDDRAGPRRDRIAALASRADRRDASERSRVRSLATARWQTLRADVIGAVDALDERLVAIRTGQFAHARSAGLDAQGLGYLGGLIRAQGSSARLWRADPRIREAIDDYREVLAEASPELIVVTSLTSLAAAVTLSEEMPAQPRVLYCCRSIESASARKSKAYRRLRRSAEVALIPQCERIIATSSQLAERLQADFGLDSTPEVVLDAPLAPRAGDARKTLRQALSLEPDVPLLVHTGALAAPSGLSVAVKALPELPGAHLAIYAASPSDPALEAALGLAARLGVRERVHPALAPSPGRLASALAGVDIGLMPVSRSPANEEPHLRKCMDFVAAGVPIVVSDATSVAGIVLDQRAGVSFHAQDEQSLASAVRRVLQSPGDYAASDALRASMSWDAQAAKLAAVYLSLLGEPGAEDAPQAAPTARPAVRLTQVTPRLVPVKEPERRVRLFIGPANMAGQGWAWAKSVEANFEDVTTTVATMDWGDGPLQFPTDVRLRRENRQASVLSSSVDQIAADYTHALFESGLTPLGERSDADSVVRAYQQATDAGLQAALVFHGSEIRDPQAHLDRFGDSLFRSYSESELQVLRARRERTRLIAEFTRLPVYVSTPDLLAEVPDADLLPLVVDVPGLAEAGGQREILSDGIPVVLHAPSSARIAGSDDTDDVLSALDAEGLIAYRRLPLTRPEDFPAALAAADIIVDKLQLGYGVTATQAMAAGRAVVGWTSPASREHVPDLPLVDADRSNLRETLIALIRDPDRIRELGRAGQAFARERHDGRATARALAGFLGMPVAATD